MASARQVPRRTDHTPRITFGRERDLLSPAEGEDPERDLALGALLPSFFWAAQGASFAFPGAEGFEAEFPEKVPRIKDVWVNERFSSALMLVLIVIGYVAERRNLI